MEANQLKKSPNSRPIIDVVEEYAAQRAKRLPLLYGSIRHRRDSYGPCEQHENTDSRDDPRPRQEDVGGPEGRENDMEECHDQRSVAPRPLQAAEHTQSMPRVFAEEFTKGLGVPQMNCHHLMGRIDSEARDVQPEPNLSIFASDQLLIESADLFEGGPFDDEVPREKVRDKGVYWTPVNAVPSFLNPTRKGWKRVITTSGFRLHAFKYLRGALEIVSRNNTIGVNETQVVSLSHSGPVVSQRRDSDPFKLVDSCSGAISGFQNLVGAVSRSIVD